MLGYLHARASSVSPASALLPTGTQHLAHYHKPSRTCVQSVLSHTHCVHQGKKNWLFEVCKQPKPLVPISWSSCCPAEEVRAVAMVLVTLVGKSMVCNPPLSGLILPSGQEVFVGMAASASWGWGGCGQLWIMSSDGLREKGVCTSQGGWV